MIDRPGAYRLMPAAPDEPVMLELIEGRHGDEPVPELIAAVVDATHLRSNLRRVLELTRLGRPCCRSVLRPGGAWNRVLRRRLRLGRGRIGGGGREGCDAGCEAGAVGQARAPPQPIRRQPCRRG